MPHTDGPVEIAAGIFWVGTTAAPGGLRCNPYLLVDGDEAVLVDPGSVLDFPDVLAKLRQVVPLSRIRTITLSHQDPDLASMVPLLEREGFRGRVACHWRTALLAAHYGIASPFYPVDKLGYRLKLDSGRVLRFIHAPYLHSPGSIVLYDSASATLFSGDLFGSLVPPEGLFADKATYLEPMLAFHEQYMPSNDVLRPVMELLLRLRIGRIAPQHGAVIAADVRAYIVALRDLECGAYLHPLRRALARVGGYGELVNQVLGRLVAAYGADEVRAALGGGPLALASGADRLAPGVAVTAELWEAFFAAIAAGRGFPWLTLVEGLVHRACRTCGLAPPAAFRSSLGEAYRELDFLGREKAELQRKADRLRDELRAVERLLIHDPVTDLYNEHFLRGFLAEQLPLLEALAEPFALLVVDVDDFDGYGIRRGLEASDELLRGVAWAIGDAAGDLAVAARTGRDEFIVYVPRVADRAAAEAEAEQVRNAIASSQVFLEPVTVSLGVVYAAAAGAATAAAIPTLFDAGRRAVAAAVARGGNSVCGENDDAPAAADQVPRILVGEPDPATADVLVNALGSLGAVVELYREGPALLDALAKRPASLVVTELMLPGMDAFRVRARLAERTDRKDIPFIALSYLKDEDSVARALGLGIGHYLKKPVLLAELVGIAALVLQRKT